MAKQNNRPHKPRTEVILKHKEVQSINEFANFLETIAAKLKNDGEFTFIQGEEQIVVQPSEQMKVEYEYEVKGDKHSFEIEFDWQTGKRAPKTMRIE